MKNGLRCAFCWFVIGLSGCRGQDASPRPAIPPSSVPTPGASAATSAPPTTDAATSAQPAVAPTGARSWNFDSDKAGAPPAGFSFGRTGEGRDGKWVVRTEAGAPSGSNVLAQTDADTTDHGFPVAIAEEPTLRDLELSVRCKPASGIVDQACGLVFRVKDSNNYYVTRANALEGNVRLYFVKDGHRQQIATHSGKVTSGAWHDYRVVARGDHFEVFWDGAKVIDQHDPTFVEAGKVGLWTKADSVTYFDDLSAKPLN